MSVARSHSCLDFSASFLHILGSGQLDAGDRIWTTMHDAIKRKIELFPRFELGYFPSPVRKISIAGNKSFWIKDDGASSLVYGGNKVRKLEYLLADARRQKKSRLVVHGDVDSHTVMACCLFGRHAGVEVDAVVFPHGAQTFDSPAVHQLADAGVCIHRMKNMLSTVCFAWFLGLRSGSYLIPMGGSTPLSSLGYVRAAMELCEQAKQGLLPEPERIYIPFATGGSVAGLLIGLALTGSSVRVVAVQTVEGIIANRRRLKRLVISTLALIGAGDGFSDSCMDRLDGIDGRFLGKGYRDVPPAVISAVQLASDHGLELEPVFSGKALASLLDAGERDESGELLFWNTHDQQHARFAAEDKLPGDPEPPYSAQLPLP